MQLDVKSLQNRKEKEKEEKEEKEENKKTKKHLSKVLEVGPLDLWTNVFC